MSSPRWAYPLTILAILSIVTLPGASAIALKYCSSLNTASTPGNYSQFQSNGLCYNFCLADYAFAVLQGSECYCSDYVPGTTASTGDCNKPCPGYPDDLCGNEDTDLFAYLALTLRASGTKGASATSSRGSSSSDETTTAPPSSSKTHSSSSMTWTPTPTFSLYTTTGEVRTVTITPTAPPNSGQFGEVTTNKKSGGLSTGGAVGLTVGLVALVALVCAIIYFCWRRRQKERENEKEVVDSSRRGSSAGLGGPIPSRTMSENSRYVLNTDGRQVIESYEGDMSLPGSRRSRLIPVDPRLNPHAPLYQRGGENKSRESVNTIRDDHDYSRPVQQQGPILRATNPD